MGFFCFGCAGTSENKKRIYCRGSHWAPREAFFSEPFWPCSSTCAAPPKAPGADSFLRGAWAGMVLGWPELALRGLDQTFAWFSISNGFCSLLHPARPWPTFCLSALCGWVCSRLRWRDCRTHFFDVLCPRGAEMAKHAQRQAHAHASAGTLSTVHGVYLSVSLLQ